MEFIYQEVFFQCYHLYKIYRHIFIFYQMIEENKNVCTLFLNLFYPSVVGVVVSFSIHFYWMVYFNVVSQKKKNIYIYNKLNIIKY